MYRNQSAVTLREAIARPRAQGEILRDETQTEQLRDQVFAVVDDLKRLEWPPERVIVAVKQIARDGGLTPSHQFIHVDASLSNGDAVLARVVRWAIDRYYYRC
jgi:hypothetical protein